MTYLRFMKIRRVESQLAKARLTGEVTLSDLKAFAEECPKSYLKAHLLLELGTKYMQVANYGQAKDVIHSALNLFYDEKEFIPCGFGDEHCPQSPLLTNASKFLVTNAHCLLATICAKEKLFSEGKDHMKRANLPEDDTRLQEYFAYVEMSLGNYQQLIYIMKTTKCLSEETAVCLRMYFKRLMASSDRSEMEAVRDSLLDHFQTISGERNIQFVLHLISEVVFMLNPTEAEPYLNAAVLLNNDSSLNNFVLASLHQKLAQIYSFQTKYQDAEFNCLETLHCREYLDRSNVRVMLAHSLVKQGKLTEAKTVAEENIADLKNATEKSLELTQTRNLLTYICDQLGDVKAAKETAQAAFDYLPLKKTGDTGRTNLRQFGLLRFRAGEYAEADELLTNSLNSPLSSEDVESLLALARMYDVQKMPAKTVQRLDQVEEIMRTHPTSRVEGDIYELIAGLYFRAKQLEKTEMFAKLALKYSFTSPRKDGICEFAKMMLGQIDLQRKVGNK